MTQRKLNKSNEQFDKAITKLPLGVSSNFRYWGDDKTLYIKCGKGARIWDLDDNEYIEEKIQELQEAWDTIQLTIHKEG